jgi:hypothetical protein
VFRVLGDVVVIIVSSRCVPAFLSFARWIQGTPTQALLKEILGTAAECSGS